MLVQSPIGAQLVAAGERPAAMCTIETAQFGREASVGWGSEAGLELLSMVGVISQLKASGWGGHYARVTQSRSHAVTMHASRIAGSIRPATGQLNQRQEREGSGVAWGSRVVH